MSDAVQIPLTATAALELRPTVSLVCPCCQRRLSEAGWRGLPWLQYAGVTRGHGVLFAVEVRRCVCTAAIAREVLVPTVRVEVPTAVQESHS